MTGKNLRGMHFLFGLKKADCLSHSVGLSVCCLSPAKISLSFSFICEMVGFGNTKVTLIKPPALYNEKFSAA